MKTHSFFPTHVWEIDCEVPEGMIDYAFELKEVGKSVKLSNRSGSWHSLCNLHRDENFCENYLNKLLDKINELDFMPLFKVTACWININGKGALNIPHSHPGCDLSLVWYIKTPENCGDLELENPFLQTRVNLMDYFPEDFTIENTIVESVFLPPVEGKCYIFPSDLRHSVLENNTDEYRISFSANLKFLDYDF